MSKPRVLVLGAGVSGLTTALCLTRAGFRVTILAEQVSPALTSNAAGALWEWPPAVCGRHHEQALLGPSKTWAQVSYQRFRTLAAHPRATGVFLRPANFYFPRPLVDDWDELSKMRELAEVVLGFRHDPQLIHDNGIRPEAGVVDAYTFLAPMIDSDRYLHWLHRELTAAGATLHRGRVHADLASQHKRLLHDYNAQLIINCTGLGARELAADHDLSPHRGAVIRLDNTGRYTPRITAAHCVANDPNTHHQNMIFIVPRGEDRLLLGGLVEPDEWATDINLTTHAPIRDMLRRNTTFLPALTGAHLDHADPVRVGLRPFRTHNVRLEHDPDTHTIHNYGHGGAGFSLSWGCAEHATHLAEQVLTPERAPTQRADATTGLVQDEDFYLVLTEALREFVTSSRLIDPADRERTVEAHHAATRGEGMTDSPLRGPVYR